MLNYKYFSTTSHHDGSIVWRCIICGRDFDTESIVRHHQVIDHLSDITKVEPPITPPLKDTVDPAIDDTNTPNDVRDDYSFRRERIEIPAGVQPPRSKSKIIGIAVLAIIVGGFVILNSGLPTGIIAPANTTSTTTSTSLVTLTTTSTSTTISAITTTATTTSLTTVTSTTTVTTTATSTTIQTTTTKTTTAQTTTTQTTTTQTTTTSTTIKSTSTKSVTSSTSTKADSPLLKPNINITTLEIEIHDLINVERRNKGLKALSLDPKLSDIARDHSKDMALNNFFSHTNLRGQDPTDRAKAQGYNPYKNFGAYYTDGIAENILQNNLYDSITYINGIPTYHWNSQSEIARSSVQLWMNSPGHRQNILDPTYDKEGIGIAISSDGKVYVTQDFW